MKSARYFEEAKTLLASGKVDEDVFWAMLDNSDIFCEDDEEED